VRTAAFISCLLLSVPAGAEALALAVSLPDQSVAHRDFAAGLVQTASARHQMLAPQLTPDDVSRCRADEACLLAKAGERAASHLLSVGVAALGPEELAVSLRVVHVASGAVVLNLSDLVELSADPRAAGRALAERAFAGASGLPPRAPPAPSGAPVGAAAAPPSSGLALVGYGVLGASAVAGLGGGVASALLLYSSDRSLLYPVATGAAVGVASGVAVGLGLVVTDALLPRGE
jgi:hypothetical protein